MSEIADQLGNSIPVIKGDGGPYWEDGIYSDTQNAILARQRNRGRPRPKSFHDQLPGSS